MNAIRFGVFLIVLTSVATVSAADVKLTAEQTEFFEKKIRPVLVENCYQCHSTTGKSVKGGLVLDTRQGWMTGGDSGPAIRPEDPDDSLLIQAVRHENLEMPPKKKLPDHIIADLTRWVEMGAPDPRAGAKASLIRREIDLDEGRKFWAFVKPKPEPAPSVKDTAWPRSDLDRIVLAKLEEAGLKPVGDAPRRALLRRICFDLVGLPPTQEQIDQFLRDDSPKAFERIVDVLLNSPQFGERWGRHWLDVARYSESVGMERNFTFPHAWRYRDYVIKSLNEDKPFDRFIQEQIAGDLLPDDNPTPREDRIVATGFLAMGPKSLNERDKRQFRMDIVDEQIDTTTRAVLGLTVSCARCHDHKFDPFPTEDYYAIAGIFRSSKTLYGTNNGQGNRQPADLIPLGKPKDAKPVAPPVDMAEVRRTLTKKRKAAQAKMAAIRKETGKNARQLLSANSEYKKLNQQVQRFNKELKRKNKKGKQPKRPTGPVAMGVVEGPVDDCPVHIRGNVATLGDVVPRGFLQVVHMESAPEIKQDSSGRLELVQWMTSTDNPLTARVLANRVWHHLFGAGIVRTMDNFGATGEAPSNQQLLDHLALRVIENGWSLKSTIREVVLSRTYQLSSDHSEANYQADPQNRMIWQMSHRRLSIEAIRDSMLAAAGQLDLTPVEKSPVFAIGDTNVGRNTQLLRQIEADNNHRSVYQPIVRNAIPEILKAFDFAEPSIIVGRRNITTVPTQALFMMNSQFIMDRSTQMAARLLTDKQLTNSDRINMAYELALTRSASADEMASAEEFIKKCLEQLTGEDKQTAAWASLCQALFASAEFRYLE